MISIVSKPIRMLKFSFDFLFSALCTRFPKNCTALSQSESRNIFMCVINVEIIRRDRNRHGGGVCIYVSTFLNFSIRSDLLIRNLENLAVQIRYPQSAPVVVVNWYRPPNSTADIFTSLEILIGRLDSECVEFYLMGDMNCNMTGPGDNVSLSLLDITRIYDLQQIINEATRITESTSTVIDLIFTNCPDRVIFSGVTHIAFSDHSLVYAYHKLSSNPVTNKGHDAITYQNVQKVRS